MWNAVPSMAANSSSCARAGEVPAERDAAQLGIHQHRAVAVVPGQAQQAGLAGAVLVEARESAATLVPARRAMASKISPVAESPASMPVLPGWIEPGTTPQTPGISAVLSRDGHDAGRGAHHVDHVAHPAAGADGIPMRVERAHGNGNAGAQAELGGPLGRELAGNRRRRSRSGPSACRARPPAAGRPQPGTPPGQPAQGRVPHPLVAHGADAARHFVGVA